MRDSKIAPKLANGQPVRLAFMGHFLPRFVAYAAASGYDGIWLDMEHRPWQAHEVQMLLMTCHHYDIDCLVRPTSRERAVLYRYLEDGATGFIMPHVPDVETARQIVQAVKFPPIGDRGIEGAGLETNFGLDEGGKLALVDHALSETLLCIQIETPAALAVADRIAALEGVDMLFVGPADMALRLPHAGVDLTMDDVYRQVSDACRTHGKAWGSMPATLDDLRHFSDRGATLHVWGRDHIILRDGLRGHSLELDDLFGDGHT